MKGPLFYSKILLFGEYGIIEDSKGLSIPYNFFNGALKIAEKPNLESEKSNNILADFCSYLKQLDELDLDLISFEKHINKGLYFDSSIPKGYGVGSSGALVAAIYDKYSNNKITVLENLTREKLLVLKSIFSKMESFFHGKSSGLDPLNSYLSIPILIKSKDDINVTGIPSQKLNGTGAVFLIDSGKTGSTAPMVSIFMEKMKSEGFRKMISTQFIKHTNSCVDSFLNGDVKKLFDNTKELSKIVLDNFKPMIPDSFYKVWENGLKSEDYILKLCGSGGGGYILGFTKDLNKAQKQLSEYNFKVVYRY